MTVPYFILHFSGPHFKMFNIFHDHILRFLTFFMTMCILSKFQHLSHSVGNINTFHDHIFKKATIFMTMSYWHCTLFDVLCRALLMKNKQKLLHYDTHLYNSRQSPDYSDSAFEYTWPGLSSSPFSS